MVLGSLYLIFLAHKFIPATFCLKFHIPIQIPFSIPFHLLVLQLILGILGVLVILVILGVSHFILFCII